MRYTDILHIDGRFQSSINLQYDIGDLQKIDCYIPTEQSVQVLRQYLESVYYGKSGEFATVLIGPYGKGKSHLMLVLLSLLAADALYQDTEKKQECLRVLGGLIHRIEKVSAETAALARSVLSQHRPLLPVIVDSNATEIHQVLILALRNALMRSGCENLLPDTNYDAALRMTERWERDYPQAYRKLEEELLPHKMACDQLKGALAAYSQTAYEIFVQIYPTVTSGSVFTSVFSEDTAVLYKSVNNALAAQTEYRGMFIVYDEFSKFLESNLEKSRMMNFKVIQEMAELASRSMDPQMHFACITHKDLLNYSHNDSFRTVEGRFKKVWYVQSSEQSYELIANTIAKKAGFDPFVQHYHREFEAVRDKTYASGMFRTLTEKIVSEVILKGCFPLSPMTSFALLRISEMVAQNERTLFTFIAGQDRQSIARFVASDHDGLDFINVDAVYDYFSASFGAEVFNSKIHSIWAKASAALQIAENEHQRKLIKALAVILIVGAEQMHPNAVNIKTSLLMADEDFLKESDRLCALQVLTKREISGEYAFLTPNGVDIHKSLNVYITTKLATNRTCDVLMDVANPGLVLPRQYNYDYKIIRYFRRVFMDTTLFCTYTSGTEMLNDQGSDGVIVQLVALSDAEREAAIAHYRKMDDAQCVLLAVSDHDFALEGELQKVVAIQALKKTDIAQTDKHYAEELELFEEDLLRYLQKQMAFVYSTTNPTCRYYYSGEWKIDLTKEVQLARLISEICAAVFPLTPKINNEMINKTMITGQIKKARMEVASKLLGTTVDDAIEWDGNGPEVSIYRSCILCKELDGLVCRDDPGLSEVLREIDQFARRAIGCKVTFSEMYQVLLSAPYRMRQGTIPIYIAYVLRRFEGTISVYWDEREFLLNAEILENVNREPNKFALYIDVATADKEAYVVALCDLFNMDQADPNRLAALMSSMQKWMRSLPKVTRECGHQYSFMHGDIHQSPIDPEVVRLRKKLLSFDINMREMLMEQIPNDVFQSDDLPEVAARIQAIHGMMNAYLPQLKICLICYARELFSPGYAGSLVQAMLLWREKRKPQTLTKVYHNAANQVLKLTANLRTNDDEEVLARLALVLEEIALEDWNDACVCNFCKKLKDTLQSICDADYGNVDAEEASFSIAIKRADEFIERRVMDADISMIGKTLMNNLRYSFEEYGDSIASDEKVAILVEMLKEMIGEA